MTQTQTTKENRSLIEEDVTADILEPIEIYGLEEDIEFITSIRIQDFDYEYNDEYNDGYSNSIDIFDEIY